MGPWLVPLDREKIFQCSNAEITSLSRAQKLNATFGFVVSNCVKDKLKIFKKGVTI